jgi:hypothetical protein
MRLPWLFGAVLLASLAGCGGSGGNAVRPASDGGKKGTAEIGRSANETTWDLPDDTVLKVSVVPPQAGNGKLQVKRRYDSEAHAPLKSLLYRLVTEASPNADWMAFPEPTKSGVGDGLFESHYEADLTLPKGTVGVQLKIAEGFGEPIELKDWTIDVK